MEVFDKSELKKLYIPHEDSSGEENGQVTIIGGSKLFHGAPILSLKIASRIVDMVFFATPEKSVGKVAEKVKSELLSFIWIPWEEAGLYVEKSDAVLIGPGFMRVKDEEHMDKVEFEDEVYANTRQITKDFLQRFPDKRWVIDAGSLQTMDADWIPEGVILTPNKHEFEMLFKEEIEDSVINNKETVKKMAKKYNCTIVLKGPETVVCSPKMSVLVTNGNAGLTKGGSGDVLAGLTAALYAKNNAFLSASAASYIAKAAADDLHLERATYYNADDLAGQIPVTFARLLES